MDAEASVQGLGAVVPAANGDALGIQYGCHVVGVDVVEIKGNESASGIGGEARSCYKVAK